MHVSFWEAQVNPTILQIKTELAKKEKENKELDIKLARCLYEIREYSNPFYGDIELLHAEELEQAADELLTLKERKIKVLSAIKQLKAELGDG